MKDINKTKDQLIKELIELRQRITKLERSEIESSLSEVYYALKKISSGDPTVRIEETSEVEFFSRLKHMVNLTAENIGEIVNLSHEFAMVLAELFDVMHKVSEGNLNARVSGSSQIELLESLKKVTNDMIEGLSKENIERKKAEESVKRLYHQNELILSAAGEGIFGLDVHGTHTFVNPAAAQMLGYTVDELTGRHSHTTWHHSKADGNPYPEDECPLYTTLKDGKAHHMTEEVFWRKDGTSFSVEYTSTPVIEDEKVIGAVVTFNDISERKHMEEELRALSLIDELTGLYNRRGFLTLVQQQAKIAERMKQEMLLIFADIDNMKLINDTLGHKEGDRALIDTANILRKTLRNSDIIARFGGDEFAVLSMKTFNEDADIINSRLQDNIKSHNEKEVRPYKISLSLGFVYHVPGSSIEELLVQADQLMYEDKKKKQGKSNET